MITTVTSNGRIVLPIAIRKALEIKTGDKLDIEVTEDGEILCRKVSNILSSLSKVLPKGKRQLSLEEMDAVVKRRASF